LQFAVLFFSHMALQELSFDELTIWGVAAVQVFFDGHQCAGSHE
jgi:hypothetical protein